MPTDFTGATTTKTNSQRKVIKKYLNQKRENTRTGEQVKTILT